MPFNLFAAIRIGLRHFGAEWRTAYRLSIGPLLGCYLAIAFLWHFYCRIICADCNNTLLYWAGLYLSWLLVSWVPTSLMLVNLARLHLFNEKALQRPCGLGWSRRETMVYLRAIPVQVMAFLVLWLVYTVVFVVATMSYAPSSSAAYIVAYLISIVAFIVVGVRLMLFPWSAALDQPMNLGAAWRQMRGRTVAVSAFSCSVYIPLYLLVGLIQTFYFDRIMPLLYWAAIAGVYLIWGLITVPVIFVLAECYRQICGDPRASGLTARIP